MTHTIGDRTRPARRAGRTAAVAPRAESAWTRRSTIVPPAWTACCPLSLPGLAGRSARASAGRRRRAGAAVVPAISLPVPGSPWMDDRHPLLGDLAASRNRRCIAGLRPTSGDQSGRRIGRARSVGAGRGRSGSNETSAPRTSSPACTSRTSACERPRDSSSCLGGVGLGTESMAGDREQQLHVLAGGALEHAGVLDHRVAGPVDGETRSRAAGPAAQVVLQQLALAPEHLVFQQPFDVPGGAARSAAARTPPKRSCRWPVRVRRAPLGSPDGARSPPCS